jgi:PIN domain nuclease of toxin-antitoxin system
MGVFKIVRYLLDTYVWVKAETSPDQLGSRCRSILADEANQLFISSISSLELAQLTYRKRITLLADLSQWVRRSCENLRIQTIDVDHEIAISAYNLPDKFHKDPADRILVATSRLRQMPLITTDDKILKGRFTTCVNARV